MNRRNDNSPKKKTCPKFEEFEDYEIQRFMRQLEDSRAKLSPGTEEFLRGVMYEWKGQFTDKQRRVIVSILEANWRYLDEGKIRRHDWTNPDLPPEKVTSNTQRFLDPDRRRKRKKKRRRS